MVLTAMHLSPGVSYYLTSPGLSLPPFTLWLTRYVLGKYAEIDLDWIPAWLWATVLLTSPAVTFAAKPQLDRLFDKQNAHRNGAVEPPMIPGKWPGYVDIVYTMLQRDGIAYLGECLSNRGFVSLLKVS
jgi:hypothetical protein